MVSVVWRNVFIFGALHMIALYGIILKCFSIQWQTRVFCFIYSYISAWGVTAGRHRYFSHRSFKGNKALDVLLVFMACTAFQDSVYHWVRDHRLHHKHSDTDADPYNSKRGFFFCHMGWLLVKKHPDVKEKGKLIDMSDLKSNPIVMFEHKYQLPLAFIFTIIVPTLVPYYFWNESFIVSLCYSAIYRYITLLHCTWTVNSLAHLWGMRGYDKNINPAENSLVSTFTMGEGYHNYHHTFPWDYKAAELSNNFKNSTTLFIDLLAAIGLVTERKEAQQSMIEKRKDRTGDSQWKTYNNNLRYLFDFCVFWLIVL